MTLEVRLRPEAEDDLADAASWYQDQRLNLGNEFLDEVMATLANIASDPLMYPELDRNTRRAVIHRFPFSIYYRVENETIVVIAVMHGSRHPLRWKTRE